MGLTDAFKKAFNYGAQGLDIATTPFQLEEQYIGKPITSGAKAINRAALYPAEQLPVIGPSIRTARQKYQEPFSDFVGPMVFSPSNFIGIGELKLGARAAGRVALRASEKKVPYVSVRLFSPNPKGVKSIRVPQRLLKNRDREAVMVFGRTSTQGKHEDVVEKLSGPYLTTLYDDRSVATAPRIQIPVGKKSNLILERIYSTGRAKPLPIIKASIQKPPFKELIDAVPPITEAQRLAPFAEFNRAIQGRVHSTLDPAALRESLVALQNLASQNRNIRFVVEPFSPRERAVVKALGWKPLKSTTESGIYRVSAEAPTRKQVLAALRTDNLHRKLGDPSKAFGIPPGLFTDEIARVVADGLDAWKQYPPPQVDELMLKTIPDIMRQESTSEKIAMLMTGDKKLLEEYIGKGPITPKQLKTYQNAVKAVTKQSLDSRKLPGKFLVFRGEDASRSAFVSDEYKSLPVSLNPAVAHADFAATRGNAGRLNAFWVSKEDVIADVASIRNRNQYKWENELLIRKEALENPMTLVTFNKGTKLRGDPFTVLDPNWEKLSLADQYRQMGDRYYEEIGIVDAFLHRRPRDWVGKGHTGVDIPVKDAARMGEGQIPAVEKFLQSLGDRYAMKNVSSSHLRRLFKEYIMTGRKPPLGSRDAVVMQEIMKDFQNPLTREILNQRYLAQKDPQIIDAFLEEWAR